MCMYTLIKVVKFFNFIEQKSTCFKEHEGFYVKIFK